MVAARSPVDGSFQEELAHAGPFRHKESTKGPTWKFRDDIDTVGGLLPDELAVDAERIARFEREAKLLASLNHPNIAAIYAWVGSLKLAITLSRTRQTTVSE